MLYLVCVVLYMLPYDTILHIDAQVDTGEHQ
jgi:hypothetical protein